MENEIIIYQPDETIKLDVRLEDETVWLNRHQMAQLFGRDVKTIGKHIASALSEELAAASTSDNVTFADKKHNSVVAKFATTASDGKTYQMEHYNIDMVLSVGYRVKSQRGIDYRHWANETIKNSLIKNHIVNQRITCLEEKVAEHDKKIDFFIKTSLPPVEGVFFEGQIFDAYNLVSDLIRNAKKEIILIDNYIDDSVLKMLDKRDVNVSATIYTAGISEKLQLDLAKHNSQYVPITINIFKKFHDRFLIIDDDVYHIGASIKDLGKSVFAFSKLGLEKEIILSIL